MVLGLSKSSCNLSGADLPQGRVEQLHRAALGAYPLWEGAGRLGSLWASISGERAGERILSASLPSSKGRKGLPSVRHTLPQQTE